jgi:hypothetical protein
MKNQITKIDKLLKEEELNPKLKEQLKKKKDILEKGKDVKK